MAKFFLVLTLLAALAAAGLGWQTKTLIDAQRIDLKKTKDTLASTQRELAATKLTLKDTQDQLSATKAQLDTANATIATDKTTIDGLNTQVTTLTGQVAQDKTTIDEKDKEIAALKAAVPGGGGKTTDNPFQHAIDELNKQIDELKLTNDTLTKKAAAAEKARQDLQTQIDTHKAIIMKPGIQGMVMAVNEGYGFVVVSLGDRQGSVPNAELIVERDGHQIAKLKVTTVEAALSVADIIPDTLAKGQRILPGDKVIYSGNLAQ